MVPFWVLITLTSDFSLNVILSSYIFNCVVTLSLHGPLAFLNNIRNNAIPTPHQIIWVIKGLEYVYSDAAPAWVLYTKYIVSSKLWLILKDYFC